MFTHRIYTLLIMLVLLMGPAGCVQTENSSAQDGGIYGEQPDTGSEAFNNVRAILVSSCTGCHQYHTYSEAQMLDIGLVIAGDPENSELYNALIGSSGSAGRKDMPSSGGALTSTQLTTISNWILAL